MSWFKRWLQSWVLIFSLSALTLSCQVLFGEYKVGDQARGAGGTSGGSGPASGGSGNAQPTGAIVVVPTSDLFTSDLGAQAKFYVSLKQKPTAGVTIPILTTNDKEGTASPASLAFTTDDWNAPQVVTVTGVYDHINPGNQPYSVVVGPANSDDTTTGIRGATVTVSLTNIDNDSAGFFVSPTKGLTTTEAGGQAFFTVVLNKAPTAEVVLTLTSTDDKIGTVTPGSLRFTAENWSAPQIATVTGGNDNVAGVDRPYQVIVDPALSLDPSFVPLPAQTVSLTNLDDDRAGVMLTLVSGIDPSDTTRLRTSENGESATFAVVLNKKPSKDVTIALAVANGSTEGKATPDSLTFTDINWSAPQTVTVTGVDNDSVADGNQPYQVQLSRITSEDAEYAKLSLAGSYINLINVDNDRADIAVTLLTGVDPNDASQLVTSEQGTSAKFSVALTSKPSGPVHFTVTSTNTSEGTVSPAQLDITMDNWNAAQTVTVTGANDDSTKDGNVVYVVRISAPMTEDLGYQKLPATDVKVVNLDDDVAGITPPKLLTGVDNGTKLSTTESGGTATFSVSLTSKPTAEVRVPVASSNDKEGKVTPATLIFTPANYATAQVVTVTGVNDSMVDGNQAYTVTLGPSTSEDMNYVGLTQSVKVTNNDDDSAYIVPTPGYQGTTTEAGGTAVFGISLHSQPTASVTLTITTSDGNEGKVSPATLTFTKDNWSASQNITVTGQNDAIDDGDKMYTIAIKGSGPDANYQYAATTLTLTNKDDDDAGLKLTGAANLQTTEKGGPASFMVALTSQPTGNVNVTVSSSLAKEGLVTVPSSGTLSFSTTNWSMGQPVTITGQDDSIADGNQPYTVTLKTASSSADAKYAQLAASTVSLVNVNDDSFGVTVTSTSCDTSPGTSATFSVVLQSQPLGPVTIALSIVPLLEATIPPPTTLSFTPMNWNSAQNVTVTGADDGTVGSSTPYKVVTAAAVSAMDSNYNGFNAADVDCVNKTPAAPPPPPPPTP